MSASENYINWQHPSYRDLVIEELSRDKNLRNIFLTTMGIEGIKLTISDTGGATGERLFPLLKNDVDWGLLLTRCKEVIKNLEPREITNLLLSLNAALSQTKNQKEVQNIVSIMKEVCLEARTKWDTDKTVLSYWTIEAYSNVTLNIKPLLPLPNLEPTFVNALKDFRDMYNWSKILPSTIINKIKSDLDLLNIVGINEPRLLLQYNFPTIIEGEVLDIISSIENYIKAVDTELEIEELEKERDYLQDAQDLFATLELVTKNKLITDRITDMASEIQESIWSLESAIEEQNEVDSEDSKTINNDSRNTIESDIFSIDQLFIDL